jgi:hypothetical protein
MNRFWMIRLNNSEQSFFTMTTFKVKRSYKSLKAILTVRIFEQLSYVGTKSAER